MNSPTTTTTPTAFTTLRLPRRRLLCPLPRVAPLGYVSKMHLLEHLRPPLGRAVSADDSQHTGVLAKVDPASVDGLFEIFVELGLPVRRGDVVKVFDFRRQGNVELFKAL